MTKIGFVGVGKIGQTIAYSIVMDGLANEAVFYDIVPEVGEKFEHEMRHAVTTRGLNVEMLGTTNIDDINNYDIIVITAGKPRKEGMSRRDLFADNAKLMFELSKQLPNRNPGALYIMVTNPVDMMASVFQKYSKQFTISTGDQVETMRMRSYIAKKLKVPVTQVNGFVGGEHGEDAVIFWSTVTVKGKPIEQYNIDKKEVEEYVKKIPAEIIRVLKGTTWGPATIIKDIVRSVVKNENRVMSIAVPNEFEGEMIHVGIPTVVGASIGPTLESTLSEKDRESFNAALRDFHKTFKELMSQVQLTA
ncbi:malate dehydrogenase [Sulfolobales archaeon HS-7]|nr:malate dehydrogenase [Sulfolobales archaeon HS-7]